VICTFKDSAIGGKTIVGSRTIRLILPEETRIVREGGRGVDGKGGVRVVKKEK